MRPLGNTGKEQRSEDTALGHSTIYKSGDEEETAKESENRGGRRKARECGVLEEEEEKVNFVSYADGTSHRKMEKTDPWIW